MIVTIVSHISASFRSFFFMQSVAKGGLRIYCLIYITTSFLIGYLHLVDCYYSYGTIFIQTLLLHTNNLTTIDKCGPISNLLYLRVCTAMNCTLQLIAYLHYFYLPIYSYDFSCIQILDIHSNELTNLPADIGCLTNLQVLNVDHNKIKELPPSIGKLQALQTLSAVGKLQPNLIPDLDPAPKLNLALTLTELQP